VDASRLDVSNDGLLTAIDALIVINRLNQPNLIVVRPPSFIVQPPYIIRPVINDPWPVWTTTAEGESDAGLTDQALLTLQTDETWLDLAAPRHLRSRH
jgi:hypothetical protein